MKLSEMLSDSNFHFGPSLLLSFWAILVAFVVPVSWFSTLSGSTKRSQLFKSYLKPIQWRTTPDIQVRVSQCLGSSSLLHGNHTFEELVDGCLNNPDYLVNFTARIDLLEILCKTNMQTNKQVSERLTKVQNISGPSLSPSWNLPS